MMAPGYWTCQRSVGGEKCRSINTNRTRKCNGCGKPRPPRKRPAHMAALDLTYEHYVELQGGEFCGICGATQKDDGPRLHRDHDHRQGIPRGLLCFPCNSALRPYMTREWIANAAAYLERVEARTA